MAVTTTNLGVITAYGDAVAAGYTGTKAEWQALMASYATVAEEANQAKDDAVSAKNTAVAKATEATTAATNANTAKDTATSKATEATTAANTATTKAGEASASAQSIAQSAAQIQENTDDIDELKNTLNGTAFKGFNVFNANQYSGNNSAVSQNADGYTYTIGATDYGRTFFGGQNLVKAGTYMLFGAQDGYSFLSTTQDHNAAIVTNDTGSPKVVTIAEDASLYLGYRITNKPSASFVITPYLATAVAVEANARVDLSQKSFTGNLYENNATTWTTGYINNSGNVATGTKLLEYSDYIPVDGYNLVRKSFIYNGSEQAACGAFYDANKVFISILDAKSEIAIPLNAKYMRLNRLSQFADRWRNGNYLFMANASKWHGKTISALGDSITYGFGLTNRDAERWTTLLAQKTGAIVNNFGLNSSKVSNINDDSVQSFVDRCEQAPNSDLIIIFGGTNDYWHNATDVGTADSYNVATFGGALNYLFNYYQTQYPTKKILYVFPMHQHYSENADSHDFGHGNFNAFRNVAIGACANSGIPMLDLYATSGTNVAVNEAQRTLFTIDGVHPNALGHRLLSELIYSYIENNLALPIN